MVSEFVKYVHGLSFIETLIFILIYIVISIVIYIFMEKKMDKWDKKGSSGAKRPDEERRTEKCQEN